MTAEADERFMRRALGLAERARGLTSPNPLVGAVIVADGVGIGEGFPQAAGRPHVTVKVAMPLDGRTAAVPGPSQCITGGAARGEPHRLGSEVEAIIGGVETARRDAPALPARVERPWPREPYRVVLDTSARTP